jgi:hypothetical protein
MTPALARLLLVAMLFVGPAVFALILAVSYRRDWGKWPDRHFWRY